MTRVEIEYCVPCGLLDRAVDMQTTLLELFGGNLETVALRPDDGGVFKVRVDGETVFDKGQGRVRRRRDQRGRAEARLTFPVQVWRTDVGILAERPLLSAVAATVDRQPREGRTRRQ